MNSNAEIILLKTLINNGGSLDKLENVGKSNANIVNKLVDNGGNLEV